MRLGFSVAVNLQPDILLADEILAVGVQSFQEKCLAKIPDMRNHGMTLILVSHSMEQVNKFCDWFVRLEHGRVTDSGLTERESLTVDADLKDVTTMREAKLTATAV